MIVVRLALIVVILVIGVAVVMWVFTRDGRYLRFAYRLIQLTVLAGAIFFGIFFLERVL